ncbi:MAG: aldo/keto reductase [Verrucomicrobiia bacterium]
MNSRITRRQFITTTIAGASALALFEGRGADDARSGEFRGDGIVTLGKTGIKVSRLAHGTEYNGSRRSSAHTRLGQQAFTELLRHSFDRGVKFIDMADLYGSHPFVRETFKGIDRSKYVLLTKIWPHKADWTTPSGGAKEEVERFRKELDTDVIDICLIHCVMNDRWAEEFKRIRDELSELKQKGIVRAVGVSCHDFGALKVAAEHPWTEVIFARINPRGKQYSMDASADEVADVLKTARRNGKAVVGMKIYGAGKLIKPEEKDESLKFVFRNNLVDAITIGMLKKEEVDDTLERMSKI